MLLRRSFSSLHSFGVSSSCSSWITGKNLQAATVENFFFGGTLFNTLRKCLSDVFRYAAFLIFSPLSSIWSYCILSISFAMTSGADILFGGGNRTLVFMGKTPISYIASFNSTFKRLELLFLDFMYFSTSFVKVSLCLVFMNLLIRPGSYRLDGCSIPFVKVLLNFSSSLYSLVSQNSEMDDFLRPPISCSFYSPPILAFVIEIDLFFFFLEIYDLECTL